MVSAGTGYKAPAVRRLCVGFNVLNGNVLNGNVLDAILLDLIDRVK